MSSSRTHASSMTSLSGQPASGAFAPNVTKTNGLVPCEHASDHTSLPLQLTAYSFRLPPLPLFRCLRRTRPSLPSASGHSPLSFEQSFSPNGGGDLHPCAASASTAISPPPSSYAFSGFSHDSSQSGGSREHTAHGLYTASHASRPITIYTEEDYRADEEAYKVMKSSDEVSPDNNLHQSDRVSYGEKGAIAGGSRATEEDKIWTSPAKVRAGVNCLMLMHVVH